MIEQTFVTLSSQELMVNGWTITVDETQGMSDDEVTRDAMNIANEIYGFDSDYEDDWEVDEIYRQPW